jgi:predicted HTH domain antitoxin
VQSTTNIKLYEVHQISRSEAAEIAILACTEFLAALGQFDVTPFHLTSKELVQEVQDA